MRIYNFCLKCMRVFIRNSHIFIIIENTWKLLFLFISLFTLVESSGHEKDNKDNNDNNSNGYQGKYSCLFSWPTWGKKQWAYLIKNFSFSSPRTQHAHWKKKFLLNPCYWSFVDKSFQGEFYPRLEYRSRCLGRSSSI